MKNEVHWEPTKFVYRNGRLCGSRNKDHVGIGSRLNTDLVAGFYDHYLRLYARGRLLDLGCGTVPLYQAYRAYVTEIICVDWKSSPHPNAHIDFHCDLTDPLPFDDGSFDTIILSDALEHIPELAHLWSEMSRVLSTGGRIIVNVPFFYCLHGKPHDFYRYTEFALRRFVDREGLILDEIETIGGTPEVLTDIIAKHVQFIPVIGRVMANALQYITSGFVRTRWGRRVSQTTSQAFSISYFLAAVKAVGPDT